MNFKSVEQVLKDEAASGHDRPLASALNLADEDEQEWGVLVTVVRHPEHGTCVLSIQDGERATYHRLTCWTGVVLADSTVWEDVLDLLAHCTVAVAE